MAHLLILVTDDKPNLIQYTDVFLVEGTHLGEKALRKAVSEYLSTEEGEAVKEQNCGSFTWGDALEHVPDDIWMKHGLNPLNDKATITLGGTQESVFVDYNELLVIDDGLRSLCCDAPVNLTEDTDDFECTECSTSCNAYERVEVNA